MHVRVTMKNRKTTLTVFLDYPKRLVDFGVTGRTTAFEVNAELLALAAAALNHFAA